MMLSEVAGCNLIYEISMGIRLICFIIQHHIIYNKST